MMRSANDLPEIYLCTEAVAFHKQINGLTALVESEFDLNPNQQIRFNPKIISIFSAVSGLQVRLSPTSATAMLTSVTEPPKLSCFILARTLDADRLDPAPDSRAPSAPPSRGCYNCSVPVRRRCSRRRRRPSVDNGQAQQLIGVVYGNG